MNEELRKYLDAKFTDLRREITEEASASVKKKIKTSHSLKKKGNQKQLEFNEQVGEEVDAAKRSLEAGKLEKALDHLNRGKELLDFRNKLIVLADRSEHGWATVNEYEQDELAENSDDERRINRAEACAGRKRREAKKKKSYTYTKSRYAQSNAASFAGPSSSNQRLFRGSSTVSSGMSSQGGPARVGPCFSCGENDHWRANCPKLRR